MNTLRISLGDSRARSEEHTSELQSPCNLVCRLLLEKKKLDSVGIGELPDAADYGDVGRNTLGHVAESRPLEIPNLVRLGVANIAPLESQTAPAAPMGAYGKGATRSPGKDTTTGHWEMAGVWLEQAFPVYKNGFPRELIEEFEKQIGRKTIGNKPASGTEIIKELGEEHIQTGRPIVYTSGDSVFQV